MFGKYLSWIVAGSVVLCICVSGATIKDRISEKSTSIAEDKQLDDQSNGTKPTNFHHPLISRGYDNEYATYTTTSGGYSPTVIIALAVFGVLGVLLLLQLLGAANFRSAGSTWLPSPADWGLTAEDIPVIMTKVANWIENLPGGEDGILKRTVRDAQGQSTVALADWITAYKKDPVQYQYIRKLACQTLGKSELAQRSVESQLGKTLLATLGHFMEDGTELVETVHDVIGHPEKCMYIAFVNEDEDEESNEDSSTLEENKLK